jgi:hypothetical protein
MAKTPVRSTSDEFSHTANRFIAYIEKYLMYNSMINLNNSTHSMILKREKETGQRISISEDEAKRIFEKSDKLIRMMSLNRVFIKLRGTRLVGLLIRQEQSEIAVSVQAIIEAATGGNHTYVLTNRPGVVGRLKVLLQAKRKRVVCHQSDRSVWLDGQMQWAGLDEDVYAFFVALADAYPDPITFPHMQKRSDMLNGVNQSRLKGKIKKIKKLAKLFKPIPGKGYTLVLPTPD